MAQDDGAPLLRLPPPRTLSRKRRKPSFPGPPPRNPGVHAELLRRGAEQAREHLRAAEVRFPALATDVPYLRLDLAPKATLTDDEVRSLGLVPVFRRDQSILVAHGTDASLARFEAQVHSYARLQKKLAALAKVDHIGPWLREDRVSPRLREFLPVAAETYTVDIVLLPLEDDVPNPQALRAIEEFVASEQGQVVDRALGRRFTALRVRMGGQSLDALLEYRDDVALVDLPPKAHVLVPAVLGLALDAIPEVTAPQPTAPALCVVDSGILEAHPLLEPAILGDRSRSFPAALGPPVPTPPVKDAGHGTNTAGVALYGDVGAAAVAKVFSPELWIVNARVLDDECGFHPDRMPFLRDVVEHAKDRCRVFNLSYGFEQCPGFLSKEAAELDELTREHGVLFVVSSGNGVPDALGLDPQQAADNYPRYLKREAWRVRAPAEALTALTVGALTPDRDPSQAQRTAVAPKRAPAPFSLAGGLKGVVKPELVESAGNMAYEGVPPRWASSDVNLGIPTTSHRFGEGQLLEFATGTSIAAPKVAHLAARIVARYPEATSNLLRALLVNSAVAPGGVADWTKQDVMALCGFGVPDADRALFCRPNRVTLYHEGTIVPDEVKVFEVPVPRELSKAKGRKTISVTVAFDPPVSLVRRDRPSGVSLTWGLASGDVPEGTLEAAIAAEAESEEPEVSPSPPPRRSVFIAGDLPKRAQQHGAVQKNVFPWTRGEHGETYRLAITAKATRARDAKAAQRYAVAVTLECEDAEVNVYAAVRTRVVAGRVRVQVTGS